MAILERIGTVDELWRFPVKSMQGERLTEANATLPPVRITLPTGASATSDSPALATLLSDYFHRETELIHTIPARYASRQADFFSEVGLELIAPTESFMDLCPLSLISTATLASLGHDLRRFRMNVIVQTEGEGFPDNAWLHHPLLVGTQLQLTVTMLDPRCVMTTLPQQELPKDPSILRQIVELNSQPVGTGKARPCAGVYASILQPGPLRQGEPVILG